MHISSCCTHSSEALISTCSVEDLYLNIHVHLDWPVALDPFHTYIHSSMEFTTSLSCSLWPSLSQPPPFLSPDEKKVKETKLSGNLFSKIGNGWWKEHAGSEEVRGEVMGSYTGSLYRFCANRRLLVRLVCWLMLLIEQVISVPGWLHVISEVRTAGSYWDISLIANFECAQNEIKITPMGKK